MILWYKNIKINYDGIEIITNFAAQYKEELIENEIHFNAYIVEVGKLEIIMVILNMMPKEQLTQMILSIFPEWIKRQIFI